MEFRLDLFLQSLAQTHWWNSLSPTSILSEAHHVFLLKFILVKSMFLLSRCSRSPLVPVPPRSQPVSCSAKKEHFFPYSFYCSPLGWFLHCWDNRRRGGGSKNKGTKALISTASCSLCPLQSHYSNVGFLMAHTCEIGKGSVFLTRFSGRRAPLRLDVFRSY